VLEVIKLNFTLEFQGKEIQKGFDDIIARNIFIIYHAACLTFVG
jgi:hypothetical protein